MFAKLSDPELLSNSEYQQALVRLAIWLFSILFMWLGTSTEYYPVGTSLYLSLYGCYFVFFLAVLINVGYRHDLPFRKEIMLVVDVSATSLAIVLTSDAISPFYLIYLWIYLSYGTRYGKRLLLMATLLNFSTYNLVLIYLQSWQSHGFDAFFFLLLLLVIPLYQYFLLRRLYLAKQEAESAKKARGDFLTTMTHELRTPLIGVIGMTRLMQGTPLDMEQKEYLHSIQSSADLLKSLISDVLDLSKIDANRLELLPEWFDIRNLVRSVISSQAEMAHDKQIELLCHVDPNVGQELFGDRLRISQILFNLLGNAVKFTDKGYIRVELEKVEDPGVFAQPHILLKVEDTGIGIPQDRQEAVFDSFWQADIGNARRFEGAGLGTTVVRDLTRLMGGTVEVVSQLGEGSAFSVRLPLQMGDGQLEGGEAFQLEGRCILIYEEDSKAMELHSAVARELCMKVIIANRPGDFLASLDNRVELLMVCDSLHDTSIQEILYKAHAVVPALPLIVAGYRGRMQDMGVIKNPENILFKPFLASEFAQMAMRALDIRSSRQLNLYPADMEPVDKQGINVLLAEDNAIAAKVISTLLIQRGHRVRITKDGSEALQAVSDEDYELAFIDLRMPNMDGLEFTRRYRSIEPKHRYMPIYALTANSVHEMFDRCVEAGMDGFLTKPVEPEMLDAIIEQCKLNINRPSPGEPHPVPT
ncbi:MAG: ATP-binding protein [Candidatus Thiodiazotropha endolucinida]|nr:ATP-binding protein [Candidatus Thiodiazotropha taylori]MCW4223425.1 ATP-binding protein [Candidatus Thiodiazotropha endolucinida]MCG7881378.1 ATP-binding protein [Candidatus Thiodiazotropha taylori]MCG7885002.1 ATP-binding protein [Candidatus Thiodiazotropha taylori]MCG7890945.1 ATP-binding protein [Candidatus Thiodiazotropha taylori]